MAIRKKKSSAAAPPKGRVRAAAGSSGGDEGSRRGPDATGKQLVIVESPAKAKTINKYLGADFVVAASVGHVRDLPSKAPKGSKQPVPGVDLENDFKPTYEILPGKKKTMTDLKRAAKGATQVWFATDLDREGEAIAWHLAEELGIPAASAKRVIFNAITEAEIKKAFSNPRTIDLDKVNAQQARRILDRIVGYQVSPLLWKKVARGLSAGRVQSVAVRLIVEREREIGAFVPDEQWRVTARLVGAPAVAQKLTGAWTSFMAQRDERDSAPTLKVQAAWLADQGAIRAELATLDGSRFELGLTAEEYAKLDSDDPIPARAREVAEAVGLTEVRIATEPDPDGKGPARRRIAISGTVDPAARYRVADVETKRTASRPYAPFITSSLQVSASTALGFGADRTMRVAQSLYEGVTLPKQGSVGLITYMRTDSTHLSREALTEVRDHIGSAYGATYLPEKPNFYGSSNKAAQEAHEAIRPTEVTRTPESVRSALTEDQFKLYRLIWSRFVACQMTPAEWDATAITLERSDREAGVAFRATGRTLAFDGWYRVAGVPASADDPTLPPLKVGDALAPFSIDPEQRFTSPPPRYTEASLVKKLEEEGIGRPSTYASIIKVIQDRGYVEQPDRRFRATDLGIVVTDKLIEGFPKLMDIGYTREMETQLDRIEEEHVDWVEMLRTFYGGFSDALDHALENMSHAKAEIEPAPYQCPECGSQTCYRFGKNGRFLSCTAYPECAYAAPIDRGGRPQLPETVDVLCPEDGSAMVLRQGRFGPFLASVNYPKTRFVINVDRKGNVKFPATPPLVVEELTCEKCGKPMNLRNGKRGAWLGCSGFPKCRGRMAWTKVDEAKRTELEAALEKHEKANPQPKITRRDGTPIKDGTPVSELTLPGGVQELAIHPEAEAETKRRA